MMTRMEISDTSTRLRRDLCSDDTFADGTQRIKDTTKPHLGYKLSVLLVQVGGGCHVVPPDADLALFGRSGQEQSHIIIIILSGSAHH